MDSLDLLIDLHLSNPHQGPGGDAQTELALRLTGLDPAAPLTVADIGCGTGAATLALARLLPRAHITAVDVLVPFLKRLQQRCEAVGVAGRVAPLQASMSALPLADAQFDLLWSEGAIYHMGFENGVKSWQRFLKPGGVLVASELTWTTDTRPPELQAFWDAAYPEVATAADKIRVLERHGYSPLGHFVLSETCWRDAYYRPLQAGFNDFLSRHGHSEAARAVVAEHEQEIALYEANSMYFGYGVYVARRITFPQTSHLSP
ncbi:class I SAM-dependent methyltransferase [Hydrogenophaga pseudoflava]|uniref:class I SAM-dependent methyltransferase n=1 Tax=Hydrogenophaga pseudoflava TaxID=47421 RepID=UPI0027E48787|nr:class I SAM-dependent methyltransferase [Hydrogenophaga pseudoflava]MDQ7745495.1 class I SAM-dependent methyltransferase [Hydrogenophaga pseudoflava]